MLRFIVASHTHVDTYMLGRTPLDEGSARLRDLYLYNTQHSQVANIHVLSEIRNNGPSKRAATVQRLRSPGSVSQEICLLLWKPKVKDRCVRE